MTVFFKIKIKLLFSQDINFSMVTKVAVFSINELRHWTVIVGLTSGIYNNGVRWELLETLGFFFSFFKTQTLYQVFVNKYFVIFL